MKQLNLALVAAGLSCGLAAQNPGRPPDATNTLAYRNGGEISVAHNQLDVGGGQTLQGLMAEGDRGDRVRQQWNGAMMQRRINGKLEVATATEIAGNELEPGTYQLGFRIDDDRVWHLVVSSAEGEEIFAAALDVKDDGDTTSKRLMIQPLATDNSEGKGRLQIRFGTLAASVPFHASNAEGKTSEPGQNTNQDAPKASHTLRAGDNELKVSYTQLTLAGGKNLKTLMTEGDAGKGARSFYNDSYLPKYFEGKLESSQPLRLGEQSVPAGMHAFTFRIDDELTWHLVVTDSGKEVDIPLEAEKDASAMSDRLVVQPVVGGGGEGVLSIRFGPLKTQLPFAKAEASRPSDGK